MENNKKMEQAYAFFEQESIDFRRELQSESILVDIACQFINYRATNRLTQKELAQKLQITQAMVSKLESGEYNPTVKMLHELAQKLSWKFCLEFEPYEENAKYVYENKDKTLQNEEYILDMGYAS